MGSIVLAGPMFAALRRSATPAPRMHVLQLTKPREVARMLLSLTDDGATCTRTRTTARAAQARLRDILAQSAVALRQPAGWMP
jgi:hypothetical protein